MADIPSSPEIVVIGGGSGISNLIGGLKRLTSSITAIVTMFDSGGSSGLLRKEFGYPPFGDLRQCLLALGDDTPEVQALRNAMGFRFGSDSSLNGHSVGNLIFAALTSVDGNLEHAIEEISRLLRVKGRVIPVTLEAAELCAELDDGRIIRGESDIDLRGAATPNIGRIFLDHPVKANPAAIRAISEADVIVLGPGDLYTSILPNLLPSGITDALASSGARRIYICNLMTKHGETDDFRASDFVREVNAYLAPATLHGVIVNVDMPDAETRLAYEREHAYPVDADLDNVREIAPVVLASSLASNDLPLRHDMTRTAEAIFEIMQTLQGSVS
jgi:uncharacterized cofD-like protein